VSSVQRRNKKVKNVYFRGSSSRSLKSHCDKSFELTEEILDKFSFGV
jgi:uncharacterized LabA/DUF88 family protein